MNKDKYASDKYPRPLLLVSILLWRIRDDFHGTLCVVCIRLFNIANNRASSNIFEIKRARLKAELK